MSYDYRAPRPPNRSETGSYMAWIIWGLLFILVVGVIGTVTGAYASLAARWATTPAQVFSPENVRAQWQFAYDYQASLEASARNVCLFEAQVASAPTAEDRSARDSQLLATQNNYNRIAAEYNGRLADAFRAKLVRPSDVPETAPTLTQMKRSVCSS